MVCFCRRFIFPDNTGHCKAFNYSLCRSGFDFFYHLVVAVFDQVGEQRVPHQLPDRVCGFMRFGHRHKIQWLDFNISFSLFTALCISQMVQNKLEQRNHSLSIKSIGIRHTFCLHCMHGISAMDGKKSYLDRKSLIPAFQQTNASTAPN